ncbi:MAG: hypothetical protein JWM44_1101 [Bacilli bacterium]|nr:hypothetical protein [Bacilli bacterium]
MQISNVNAGQIQSAQKTQSAKIEGSKSEEANEGSAEKAAEALKNAVAKTSGVGINFDKSA